MLVNLEPQLPPKLQVALLRVLADKPLTLNNRNPQTGCGKRKAEDMQNKRRLPMQQCANTYGKRKSFERDESQPKQHNPVPCF